MVQGKAKATISGHTIAETDNYELVEGNVYVRTYLVLLWLHLLTLQFPPSYICCRWLLEQSWRWRSSVNMTFMTKTDRSTHCPWKGDASYYTITIDGKSLLSMEKQDANGAQKLKRRMLHGTIQRHWKKLLISKTMLPSVCTKHWVPFYFPLCPLCCLLGVPL